MQLGQTTINTPYDDFTQYDPEWRYLVAAAWHSYPSADWSSEYIMYKKDPWIIDMKRYLDMLANRRTDIKPTPANRNHAMTLKWYKDRRLASTRFKLEPLLLTAAKFDIIAADLGDNEGTVPYKLYEKLFFNIRTEDGRLTNSCGLRTSFAMPDGRLPNLDTEPNIVWKVAAAQLGYNAVVTLWRWRDAHGRGALKDDPSVMYDDIMSVTQGITLERMLRGGYNNFDMNNVLSGYEEHCRVVHDTKADASDSQKALLGLMSGILNHFKPAVVRAAKTVDQQKELTQEIVSRIVSQKQATGLAAKEVVLDIGEKKLDSLLKQQLGKPKGEK